MPSLGWRSEKTKKFLKLWDSKKNTRENAKTLGISYHSALGFQHSHGLKSKSMKNKFDIKKWSNKNSLAENAIACGISYATAIFKARVHNLGYMRHKRTKVKNVAKRQVVAFLRNRGFSYDAIGKLYGVSRQRIEQVDKCYNA